MAKTNKKTEELHPLVPLPHVRNLLPHEKKMPRATEKLPKGSKGLQYKRTQKK